MKNKHIGIFATLIATTLPASAYSAPNQQNSWDVTLGLGAMVRPTYEGSDSYTAQPLPYVKAVYDDKIAIGPDGVNAYWRKDNWKLGAGFVYQSGREDEDGGIFTTGDNRLRGMGDIDSTIGAKAFASYQYGKVSIDGAATKLLGDDNDGILVEIGASRPYQASSQLILVPHIGATWANEDYMQTYFGVTPAQSTSSGFAIYNASSGIKNIDAGVRANYMLDQNWLIGGDATVKLLTGEASDSPIVQSDINGTLIAFTGYRF